MIKPTRTGSSRREFLKNTGRIAGTLAAAKRDVADYRDAAGQRPYADPWYWAGFVLIGGGY